MGEQREKRRRWREQARERADRREAVHNRLCTGYRKVSKRTVILMNTRVRRRTGRKEEERELIGIRHSPEAIRFTNIIISRLERFNQTNTWHDCPVFSSARSIHLGAYRFVPQRCGKVRGNRKSSKIVMRTREKRRKIDKKHEKQ